MTPIRQPRRLNALNGLVLVASLSVVLAACSGASVAPPASPQPPPSDRPAPSQPAPSEPSGPASPSVPSVPSSPSPVPSQPAPRPSQPSVPAVVIPADSIAEVVTDGLRVRSKPEISDASKLLAPLLDDGRYVFVIDGPVRASGYEWYLVAPLGHGAGGEDLPVGWVAAGKDGETWLEGRDPNCPEKPDTFAEFRELDPYIALACFSNEEMTFSARAIRPEATCGIELDWTIQPVWLGNVCPQPDYILIDAGADDLYTVFEPGTNVPDLRAGVEPKDAVVVTVRGHFDHEAAETCRVVKADPNVPTSVISAEHAVLICRSQFVISELRPA